MEEDILKYSPTVRFRGTPCRSRGEKFQTMFWSRPDNMRQIWNNYSSELLSPVMIAPTLLGQSSPSSNQGIVPTPVPNVNMYSTTAIAG